MSAGLYPVPMTRREPLRYQQIADDLRARIESGEFPPGAQFPPGRELEAHYGVSDGTVKHALSVLREAGWAESRQGKGVWARRPEPAPGALAERVRSLEEWRSAAERYHLDIARVLADAGLGAPVPPAPPAAEAGPLSGVWLSEYAYPSAGRGDLTGRHYVVLHQDGTAVSARSVPSSPSALSLTLTVNGQVAEGTWTERTDPGGHYGGAVYHGVIQLLVSDDGTRMEGKWAGFGGGGEVNSGPWTLTLADADVAAAGQYDRAPG
jgi:DNA-binding transcriptional regulator YhcF (GntR family)